jgi:hypothetical protein
MLVLMIVVMMMMTFNLESRFVVASKLELGLWDNKTRLPSEGTVSGIALRVSPIHQNSSTVIGRERENDGQEVGRRSSSLNKQFPSRFLKLEFPIEFELICFKLFSILRPDVKCFCQRSAGCQGNQSHSYYYYLKFSDRATSRSDFGTSSTTTLEISGKSSNLFIY